MSKFPYRYAWGNNPLRASLKGRRCRIFAVASRNSVGVEFEDGFRVVTSRRALRKVKSESLSDS